MVWQSVAVAVAFLIPSPALAWNGTLHRAVAEIAQRHLGPETSAAVTELLTLEQTDKLAAVAIWADQQKIDHPGVGPSHSIRLPLEDNRFIVDACPNQFCVTAAIEHYREVLSDHGAQPTARLEALKYLVHLVADVHQPLHASKQTGGGCRVLYKGQQVTLHKLWDSGLPPVSGKSAVVLANLIVQHAPKPASGGSAAAWAQESRQIVRSPALEIVRTCSRRTVELPDDYGDKVWPVAAKRLSQAAVRLAETLNESLGSR